MTGAVALPTDVLLAQGQTPTASAAGLAKTRKSAEAAQAFEASFLAMMLKPMFEGISTEAPFGGGSGEAMFRSFLTDAIAQAAAKRGGVGIAASVQREMLKLQGLS